MFADQNDQTVKQISRLANIYVRCSTRQSEKILTALNQHINISFNSASIGYAICFYSYSTWQGRSLFLEDLYVRPAYRKQGTGARMFREVAAIAVRQGCRRLDFHVLSWNPACEFYNHLGATNLTKSECWQFYRVEEQQLAKLAEELKS